MKWALSLFSGLGGQCEAFVSNPHWTVIRIENNPILSDVEHTRLLDVQEWMDWLPALIEEMGCPPTLVIAAPPCTEFSGAYGAPREVARRAGIPFDPDMTLLEAAIDIIEFCSPPFWIVENVIRAIPDFEPYLGRPEQILTPFVFWGSFPHLDFSAYHFRNHKTQNDVHSSNPLRANLKAMWPIEISTSLMNGVETQSKLTDWL